MEDTVRFGDLDVICQDVTYTWHSSYTVYSDDKTLKIVIRLLGTGPVAASDPNWSAAINWQKRN